MCSRAGNAVHSLVKSLAMSAATFPRPGRHTSTAACIGPGTGYNVGPGPRACGLNNGLFGQRGRKS